MKEFLIRKRELFLSKAPIINDDRVLKMPLL